MYLEDFDLSSFDRKRQPKTTSRLCVRELSSAPGAGKSHLVSWFITQAIGVTKPETPFTSARAASQFALHQSTRTHVYVAPTIPLIDHVEAELIKAGCPADRIIKITSDTDDGHVVATLSDALMREAHLGVVILCTQKALFALRYVPEDGLCYWLDEIPQLVERFTRLLPKSGRMLADPKQKHGGLGIVQDENGLARLVPLNYGKAKRYADQEHDDGEKWMRDIIKIVLSPFYRVFVDPKEWKNVAVDRQSARIGFYHVMDPHAFKNWTLLGADAQDTALFGYMRLNNVDVRPDERLLALNKLRYQVLPERDTTIKFVTTTRYSKWFLDKNPAFVDAFTDAVLDDIGDEQFLLHHNKKKCPFDKIRSAQAIPLPAKPHGLNKKEFMECTKVVCVGAFHATKDITNLMKALGRTDGEIYNDHKQMVFQAILRSARRDPSSHEHVDIYVPDLGMAQYAHARLTGSTIERLEVGTTFDKKAAMTSTERSQKSRAKNKAPTVSTIIVGAPAIPPITMTVTIETVLAAAPIVAHAATIIPDITQTAVIETPVSVTIPLAETMDALPLNNIQSEHDQTTSTHHWAWMLVVDRFEEFSRKRDYGRDGGTAPNITNGTWAYRPIEATSRKDFVAASGLVLAFNNGSLTPRHFECIFAGMTFIIYSDFQRSEAEPNRFKVFLPFADMATEQEFRAVHEMIVRKLEQHGHPRHTLGLCERCADPLTPHNMPAIHKDRPKHWFFRVREGGRSPVPSECLALVHKAVVIEDVSHDQREVA